MKLINFTQDSTLVIRSRKNYIYGGKNIYELSNYNQTMDKKISELAITTQQNMILIIMTKKLDMIKENMLE